MKTGVSQRELSLLLSLVLIWVGFAWSNPAFLTSRNLSLLMIELSITAILALGMFMVLLCGQIDLASGSGVGLFGALAAVLVFWHDWPAPLALGTSLLFAILVWLAMGWFIVRQRVPAFVVTLGGLLVFKGLHWLTIQNQTVPVVRGGESNLYAALTTYYCSPTLSWFIAISVILVLGAARLQSFLSAKRLGRPAEDAELGFLKWLVTAQLAVLVVVTANQYRGLPLSGVLLLLLALAVHTLTTRTPFGRHLYAVGGNEEAAFLSGVRTQRVVVIAYALMGGAVAVTGFLQTAYAGASTATVGQLMELDAIAACVIGGTSLRGGRGTVLGVLVGSLIMATLLNGLTLLAVSPEVKFMARGLVLVAAVWLDTRLERRG